MSKQIHIHQTGRTNVYIQKNTGTVTISSGKKIPSTLTNTPAIDPLSVFGRDNEITNLQNSVNDLKPNHALQIIGEGGIGKTTLLNLYLYNSILNKAYNHFCYINFNGSIKKSFAFNTQLIDALDLNEEVKNRSINQKFDLVISRLRQLPGSNLLIIDNVNDPEIEYNEIFNAILISSNWKVIITSKRQLERFAQFRVGALEKQALNALFHHYYTYDKNDKLLREIIELCSDHTLTVEVVAKTAQVRMFKLHELLKIIKKKIKYFKRGQIVWS